MKTRWSARVRAGIGAAWLGVLVGCLWVAAARAQDPEWPRQFDSPSGSFVIYQPQPEGLTGDRLTGRAAFSLQRDAGGNPVFGVLWFNARVMIDRDSSTVTLRAFDVTKVRLPDITPAEASRYEHLVESQAAEWDLTGSLAELRAGLASAEKERASVAGLDNTPPRIVFEYERSILLVYDGDPMLEAIPGSRLQRVANTPYAVVFDPVGRFYYLSGANTWYRARDPLGPWTNLTGPPAAVRSVVPPDTAADDQLEGPPPQVVTAPEPTELIVIDGAPRYAPLVGEELLYIANTESDVLREVSTQDYYVLLAGRWYRSLSTDGPWTFVRGDRLPESFKHVPPDSPKGNVLSAVAGTDQADDEVADAEIPQTSAIKRGGADLDIAYDGPPQFEPIEGTNLEYAVNTDAEVIEADGRYYACDQGVWYIADDPDGPWSVSETRPLDVDDIPPSCPVYDVRYAYIYDATPDVIYVGYVPAYTGCYPYYGTVVYGTGYRYHAWRRHRYIPRPCTWGFDARYNPWQDRWSFGLSYGAGFLRTGFRWRSTPRSAPVVPAPRWFGPAGYRRPQLAYDGSLLRTRRVSLHRPDRTPNNLYQRTQNVGRTDPARSRLPLRPVTRPQPTAPRPNNVFAGKDGKVYQRDDRGNWRVHDGRQWRPAQVPATPRVSPSFQPAPVTPPVPRPSGPAPVTPGGPRPTRFGPRPAPSVMPASPDPGNLEREFRGRERARDGGASRPAETSHPSPSPSPAPAPAPAPAREGERPRPQSFDQGKAPKPGDDRTPSDRRR